MRAVFKLLLCIASLAIFVKFSPLVMEKFGTYRDIVDNSEKKEIDNAALFYSEEPHSLAAEKYLKEQLKRERP
jgi:hypothetical protein